MIATSARKAELKARIQDRLLGKGLSRDLAAQIAAEVVAAVWLEWGGQKIYFHRGRTADQVWQEFNGHNKQALARKYHCTVRRIEQIVADRIRNHGADERP